MNKQKKKGFTSDTLKETAVMTIAVGIIAAAVYFFLIPSQTSISSISALAIIIAHYVPLHVSTVTMILNVVLLLIGFVTCGKEFGAKTVYTSILLPMYLAVFEHVFPDFEGTDGQISSVNNRNGYGESGKRTGKTLLLLYGKRRD